MITLFGNPISGNSHRVYTFLKILGIEFENKKLYPVLLRAIKIFGMSMDAEPALGKTKPYPAIRAWLGRVEAIEGFAPMGHASELLGG